MMNKMKKMNKKITNKELIEKYEIDDEEKDTSFFEDLIDAFIKELNLSIETDGLWDDMKVIYGDKEDLEKLYDIIQDNEYEDLYTCCYWLIILRDKFDSKYYIRNYLLEDFFNQGSIYFSGDPEDFRYFDSKEESLEYYNSL
jgi:hypothetical protein